MNILRYAFKNIFRNFFLSASSVLIITLLVFFVNVLLFVVHASEAFIYSVNDRISLTINFREGYNNTQIRSEQFLSGVAQSFSGIRVEYISRADALRILSERNPDLASLVENVEENPLPDSVRISNVPITAYDGVHAIVSEYRDILQYDEGAMNRRLLDYQTQYNQISGIVDLLRTLNVAVYVLIGLFLFTVFVVVHTVIRNFIFFLQNEVRIIELVWWRSSFIYGPFIVQGIVYVVVSVLLAFSVFLLIHMFSGESVIPLMFQEVFHSFYWRLVSEYFFPEIVIAFLIGMFSAFFASYKYIHSTIRE